MKRTKQRLTAALLLLTLMLYIPGMTALGEPAEEKDPYDWSDYDGEVILDDPEFILFDEETVDENKSDLETRACF